jgi:hypothetical protein
MVLIAVTGVVCSCIKVEKNSDSGRPESRSYEVYCNGREKIEFKYCRVQSSQLLICSNREDNDIDLWCSVSFVVDIKHLKGF